MDSRARIALVGVLIAVTFLALAPAAPASASYGGMYCVRPGDTVWSIAARNGVSPYTLAYNNGLANPNYIRVGQCLRIPAATWCGRAPCGQQTSPCGWQGCGQPVKPPVKHPCYHGQIGCGGLPVCGSLTNGRYCVRPGDTLYSIGRCFGVSPYAIAAANGLANPNCILIGQCLYIPR